MYYRDRLPYKVYLLHFLLHDNSLLFEYYDIFHNFIQAYILTIGLGSPPSSGYLQPEPGHRD
jgi:hypothetical protein